MHENNLIERISYDGAGNLSDEEILTILIGKSLSKKILNHIDGEMTQLNNISLEEICGCTNSGDKEKDNHNALMLLAALEIGKRSRYKKIKRYAYFQTKKLAEYLCEEMATLTQEHFKEICLDSKNCIIKIEEISIGSLNSSLAHPRDIFNRAIRLNANSIVLAHNHPSGDPYPGEIDIKMTRQLMECGAILGIPIIDHIIIGGNEFSSLKELGFMN